MGLALSLLPSDVQLSIFSMLDGPSLAAASQSCRAWRTLSSACTDAAVVALTGATPAQGSRGTRLRLLQRLRRPLDKRNFGYLLAWAAGSRGGWRWREALEGAARTLHLHAPYAPSPPPPPPQS